MVAPSPSQTSAFSQAKLYQISTPTRQESFFRHFYTGHNNKTIYLTTQAYLSFLTENVT